MSCLKLNRVKSCRDLLALERLPAGRTLLMLVTLAVVSIPAAGCNDGSGDDDLTETPDATTPPDDGTPSGDDDATAGDDDDSGTQTPEIVDAAPGDVVITEIMYNPRAVSDTTGEWFEVTNTTPDKTIDLNGWTILSGEEKQVINAPAALVLAPGELLVFGSSLDPLLNGGVTVDYAYQNVYLNNGGDALALQQGELVIDSIAFTFDVGQFPNLEGHSISLDPRFATGTGNDLPGSWCASFDPLPNSSDFGTPGAANAQCGADADHDYYTVPLDCDDSSSAANPNMGEVPENSTDDDCDGKIDEAPTYPPGSLLITEIMYDPGVVADTQGEWFEVYNTTSSDIDMKDWVIGDASNTHVILEPLLVPAFGYLVLGTSDDTLANGGVSVDYVYPSLQLNNVNEASLGYADTVRLMAENLPVDSVSYDAGPEFPVATGGSLSLSPDTYDPALNDRGLDWCVATSSFGAGDTGTPGEDNDPCPADVDGDGYRADADCNDGDASVYPGAPEVEGNSVDDDCDTGVDEPAPAEGLLVISELMINPSVVDDTLGEYVELYNPGDVAVDINGWTLGDGGGESVTIDHHAPLLVTAKGYLVLGKSTDLAANGGIPVDYAYGSSFGLVNTDDEVILAGGQVTVDAVEYDKTKGWSIPTGASLSLSPLALNAIANDSSLAWCASTSVINSGSGTPDKGTPGKGNDGCL